MLSICKILALPNEINLFSPALVKLECEYKGHTNDVAFGVGAGIHANPEL